jgi:hypothetical protein
MVEPSSLGYFWFYMYIVGLFCHIAGLSQPLHQSVAAVCCSCCSSHIAGLFCHIAGLSQLLQQSVAAVCCSSLLQLLHQSYSGSLLSYEATKTTPPKTTQF